MSSQKTTNYDLNQWLPDDAVLRTDFNADNAKIDAALSAMSEQVVQKANQSALDTLITAVNQKAGQDDLTALEGTVAGHTTQLAQKGNCRIVYGTYTGNGLAGSSNPTNLTFDGTPLAVFVMAQTHNSNTWSAFLPMIRGAQWASANTPCTVTWTENGVSWYHNEGSAFYQLSRGTNFYVALLEANG